MKRPVSLKALTKNHLQQNYNKCKIISMHKVFYLKECINKWIECFFQFQHDNYPNFQFSLNLLTKSLTDCNRFEIICILEGLF